MSSVYSIAGVGRGVAAAVGDGVGVRVTSAVTVAGGVGSAVTLAVGVCVASPVAGGGGVPEAGVVVAAGVEGVARGIVSGLSPPHDARRVTAASTEAANQADGLMGPP